MDFKNPMSETAQSLADRWGFSPTEELPAGYCSYVYADTTRALKAPWRGEEQTSGYRAALALGGWWGPKVFESDEASGAVLMERICPGTTMADSGLPEEEARQIVVALMKELQGRVDPQGYPTLRDYFLQPNQLLDELLETTETIVFVHGDLHHFNVLKSDSPKPWIPIDPKGLACDPAYEPVAFLRNQLDPNESLEATSALIQSRLNFFARELELDPVRMAKWGLVDQLDAGEDRNDLLIEVYRTLI
jgi:streptomycin 6-kinase